MKVGGCPVRNVLFFVDVLKSALGEICVGGFVAVITAELCVFLKSDRYGLNLFTKEAVILSSPKEEIYLTLVLMGLVCGNVLLPILNM